MWVFGSPLMLGTFQYETIQMKPTKPISNYDKNKFIDITKSCHFVVSIEINQ
jgi:hypothetical protein